MSCRFNLQVIMQMANEFTALGAMMCQSTYYSGKLIRSKYIALVGECLSFSERNINPHFS